MLTKIDYTVSYSSYVIIISRIVYLILMLLSICELSATMWRKQTYLLSIWQLPLNGVTLQRATEIENLSSLLKAVNKYNLSLSLHSGHGQWIGDNTFHTFLSMSTWTMYVCMDQVLSVGLADYITFVPVTEDLPSFSLNIKFLFNIFRLIAMNVVYSFRRIHLQSPIFTKCSICKFRGCGGWGDRSREL